MPGVVGGPIVAQCVVIADEAVLAPQVDAPPGARLALACHVVAHKVAAHHSLGVCLLTAGAAGLHLQCAWILRPTQDRHDQ